MVAVDRVDLAERRELRFYVLLARAVELAVALAIGVLLLVPELACSRASIAGLGALSIALAFAAAWLLAGLAREAERLWLAAAAARAPKARSWLLPIHLLWFLVPRRRHRALQRLERERVAVGARMLREQWSCWAYLALLMRLNAQAVELMPRTLVLSIAALATALIGAAGLS